VNEMDTLRRMRSHVPLPPDDATRAAEARFMTLLRQEPVRRPARRFAWSAGLAAGLATAVAVGVLLAPGAGRLAPGADRPGQTGEAPLELISAAQVLDLAATATKGLPELSPRPDQAIMVKSTAMGMIMSAGRARGEGGLMHRSTRTVWWPADGVRDGVLEQTYLEMKPIPGLPSPKTDFENKVGKPELLSLKICPDSGEYARKDFAYVSALPTTPEAMLAYLQNSPGENNPLNERAFAAAGDLLLENYLPPAQRAAVYRALRLIPGLNLVPDAEDGAGRKGVAVAYDDNARGRRTELIFDPASFRYLGERSFSLDPKYTRIPAGTQIGASALLSAEVVDIVPTPPARPTCG
jgi:hypothetical protein